MIHDLLSLYGWRYPEMLVYMLQSTEYRTGPYVSWYWQTTDFSKVAHRRTLAHTRAAFLLLWALRLGMAMQVTASVALVMAWYVGSLTAGWAFGMALFLSYPLVWAHAVVVPLVLGRWLVVVPKQRLLIRRSEKIFKDHQAITIAIIGSYGKTTMKELLLTVLEAGKKVVATPANKNVAVSHAQFARTLQGDEDVVIIEYGEGAPGDVAQFARVTHPDYAVITGVAPAHLDRYKTVERAAQDIFSISNFVRPDHIFVNTESDIAKKCSASSNVPYDRNGVLGWELKDIAVGITGTRFTMTKQRRSMHLQSSLIGRHQVGPLALSAALADMFGMSEKQIQAGIAATAPFEHRMEPYQLGDAWIIDDTYNGNIEGIRAGTALLHELTATRKIYVTPGLVDQGKQSAAIHSEVGELIAAAKPDVVVLMRNSAADDIKRGLHKAGYTGELLVQDDPLAFYTNLQSFVAAGDVVLMQNDWTDNYA